MFISRPYQDHIFYAVPMTKGAIGFAKYEWWAVKVDSDELCFRVPMTSVPSLAIQAGYRFFSRRRRLAHDVNKIPYRPNFVIEKMSDEERLALYDEWRQASN